jgi:hypothetical protein
LQFLFTSHRNIGFLGQRKRIVLPHQLVLVYPPTCTSWTVCLPCLPACLPACQPASSMPSKMSWHVLLFHCWQYSYITRNF